MISYSDFIEVFETDHPHVYSVEDFTKWLNNSELEFGLSNENKKDLIDFYTWEYLDS